MSITVAIVVYVLIGFVWAYISHRKDWYLGDDGPPLEYFLLVIWPLIGVGWIIIFGLIMFIHKLHTGIQLLFTSIDTVIAKTKRAYRKRLTPKVSYTYEDSE